MIPPKPTAAGSRSSLVRLLWNFRRDLLSALPQRFYHAWMAEFKSPLVHSFFCNDPALVKLVLQDRPDDFPKSTRQREGLAPLLGNSIFVTNGDVWRMQRRIIDPAFDGGNLRNMLPAIWSSAEAMLARLVPQEIDIEPEASHAAADVIFRALFSLPIEHDIADKVFRAFQDHQAAQPLVNLAAIVPLPHWVPRLHSRRARQTAQQIRHLIETLVQSRLQAIEAGTAPDDLATKILTTADPVTGHRFTGEEMIDQVAIFFLAGHETSASAFAWAVWLLAAHPLWQDKVRAEARALEPDLASISKLKVTRAVFREALRLYPPVPMMVREASQAETFRDRAVPKGAQIVLSPWHLQRHERLWQQPDTFDPGRWFTPEGKSSAREAYIPFSAGQRVCPGAGLAMLEGVVMLARTISAFDVSPGAVAPVPVARLTVRGRDGIRVKFRRRSET